MTVTFAHEVTAVHRNCVGFICSGQPKMELLAAEAPLRCPVCGQRTPLFGKTKGSYGNQTATV
jgi:hypothetical protein